MARLPEQLAKFLPVLGTGNKGNIERFRREYGRRIVAVDPEEVNDVHVDEPRTLDPVEAAIFKTRRIINEHKPKENRPMVAFGADVIFSNEKGCYIKPKGDREELIAEAVDWYCSDSFVVHWLIAFSIQTTEGLKRVAMLDVEGHYLEPLDEDEVIDGYHPKINSRFPLVEAGREGKANFKLSNAYEDDEIDISQELAERLIVERVLPMAMLNSILEDENPAKIDHDGEVWDYAIINLLAGSEEFEEKNELRFAIRYVGLAAKKTIKRGLSDARTLAQLHGSNLLDIVKDESQKAVDKWKKRLKTIVQDIDFTNITFKL